MYRRGGGRVEVFLVHPGGPFWMKKDLGAWSIPKGEYEFPENALDAARREFEEETGFKPHGAFVPLTPLRQKSGKIVEAWAFEGDCDPSQLKSNAFEMEWPPHSSHRQEFPEVDRADWFDLEEARRRILPGQKAFLDELYAVPE